MKNIIPKRDLIETRYIPIYGPNWLSNGEDSQFFAFHINTSLYTSNNILSILKLDSDNRVISLNDTLLLFPLEYKSIVSQISYDHGFILNLSSFIPPYELNSNKYDNILDICAAPGVKTAQIFLKNYNNITLTAVEKDQKRFFQMNVFLENLFGQKEIKQEKIKTINLDSRFLNSSIYYDKVLCDVPCSAEGEMIINKDYSRWNSKLINSYTNTQKAILAKAITLTKSGGQIVYSTCTLSPEENEEVINWALKRFDIKIESIVLPDFKEYSPKIVKGNLKWGIKNFDPEIEKCIRIVPDNIYEGFFVALLNKL